MPCPCESFSDSEYTDSTSSSDDCFSEPSSSSRSSCFPKKKVLKMKQKKETESSSSDSGKKKKKKEKQPKFKPKKVVEESDTDLHSDKCKSNGAEQWSHASDCDDTFTEAPREKIIVRTVPKVCVKSVGPCEKQIKIWSKTKIIKYKNKCQKCHKYIKE